MQCTTNMQCTHLKQACAGAVHVSVHHTPIHPPGAPAAERPAVTNPATWNACAVQLVSQTCCTKSSSNTSSATLCISIQHVMLPRDLKCGATGTQPSFAAYMPCCPTDAHMQYLMCQRMCAMLCPKSEHEHSLLHRITCMGPAGGGCVFMGLHVSSTHLI